MGLGKFVILSFSSRKLRRLCEHHEEQVAVHGEQAASIIKAALADLVAAKTLQDVLVGQLYEHAEKVFTWNIGAGFQIVFKVINRNSTTLPNGQTDPASVNRIYMESIEHGSST